MKVTLVKTAYSVNITERRDRSVAAFDPDRRPRPLLRVQAFHSPGRAVK